MLKKDNKKLYANKAEKPQVFSLWDECLFSFCQFTKNYIFSVNHID